MHNIYIIHTIIIIILLLLLQMSSIVYNNIMIDVCSSLGSFGLKVCMRVSRIIVHIGFSDHNT